VLNKLRSRQTKQAAEKIKMRKNKINVAETKKKRREKRDTKPLCVALASDRINQCNCSSSLTASSRGVSCTTSDQFSELMGSFTIG